MGNQTKEGIRSLGRYLPIYDSAVVGDGSSLALTGLTGQATRLYRGSFRFFNNEAAATASYFVQFNADTTAGNYSYGFVYQTSSTPQGVWSAAQRILGAATSKGWCTTDFTIKVNAGMPTVFQFKSARHLGNQLVQTYNGVILWKSTADVTNLTITSDQSLGIGATSLYTLEGLGA